MSLTQSIVLGIICGAVIYYGYAINDKLYDIKYLLIILIEALDEKEKDHD